MFVLIGFVIFMAIPAAISAAVAFALRSFAPRWSLRRRTSVAAFTAGMLLMAVPIAAAATDPKNEQVIASVLGILVAGLLISCIIGLPVALVVGRGRGKGQADPSAFD